MSFSGPFDLNTHYFIWGCETICDGEKKEKKGRRREQNAILRLDNEGCIMPRNVDMLLESNIYLLLFKVFC